MNRPLMSLQSPLFWKDIITFVTTEGVELTVGINSMISNCNGSAGAVTAKLTFEIKVSISFFRLLNFNVHFLGHGFKKIIILHCLRKM